MFNSNQELRDFASILCEELKHNDEFELANELRMWNEDAFTSSTEFLGELMLILEKVILSPKILSMKPQTEECLSTIKKALG
ncbi:MAG: hypothetical protein HGA49_06065 [Eubacteriaceae bacterium]|nr:hypothetical protein [Eubacteriaceae bacterium]